jgi:hypothetical protein
MKQIVTCAALAVVALGPENPRASAHPHAIQAQAGTRDLSTWVGNWTMVGTWKDSSNDKERVLIWRLHGRWILGGRAVQTEQQWIQDGVTMNGFEVLSLNEPAKSLVSYGVWDSGGGWTTTLVIKGDTGTERGELRSPDGAIENVTWSWRWNRDRMSVSAVCETERNGLKWESGRLKGTKTP